MNHNRLKLTSPEAEIRIRARNDFSDDHSSTAESTLAPCYMEKEIERWDEIFK